MSERRCLFCQYFDAGIPAENLLAEDDAVARRWGPQVGFGGHCTHPNTPYRLRNQNIERPLFRSGQSRLRANGPSSN
jgi:hypothetical protein